MKINELQISYLQFDSSSSHTLPSQLMHVHKEPAATLHIPAHTLLNLEPV